MTRLVILTAPCLPVQVIVYSSWYAVEDSNPYIEIRNLVSYSIERTAQCKLVGILRIELRPHAPKAWMQRVTPYPDINGGQGWSRTNISCFSDRR